MSHRPDDRYHAMDALRAAMMLAVVVLHVAMFYTDRPAIRAVFRFADPDQGPGFDFVVIALQQTSMPAFFLATGFFTAMLVARRGGRATFTNRLKRITLPFFAFWLPLYVLILCGVFYGCMIAPQVTVPDAGDIGVRVRHIGAELSAGRPLRDALAATAPRPIDMPLSDAPDPPDPARPVVYAGPGLAPADALGATARLLPVAAVVFFRPDANLLVHLWFLWVLTIFAVATVVLGPLVRRLPAARLAPLIGSFLSPFLLAVPLALSFYAHGLPHLPPAKSVLVPWPTLFGYALFFATGALLWAHRERLPAVGTWWPAHVLIAAAALLGALTIQHRAGGALTEPLRWAMGACAAVAHTQFTWAAVGFFGRFFNTERGWVRYVSDSSYWVYLIHLPLVVWAAALLLPWDASRYVKFPLVLAISAGLSVLSYHVFVRYTWLGVFLNGRRAGPRS